MRMKQRKHAKMSGMDKKTAAIHIARRINARAHFADYNDFAVKLRRVGAKQWQWGENGTVGTLQEAIAQARASQFFRRKTPVPTQAWDDMQGVAHALAFVSAGAMQTELLNDLKAAIDEIISGNGTIAVFKEKFSEIVDNSGWQLKGGGKAWRAKLIVQMNVASAYAIANAIEAKENQARRQYASWELGGSMVHRPLHVAESKKKVAVLVGSAYYTRHQFPLGYGCNCFWKTWTKEDAIAAGYTVQDDAESAEGVIEKGFGGDRLKTYLESLHPADVPQVQKSWWEKAIGAVKTAFDKVRGFFQ